MLTALLSDGNVVHANNYDEIVHGFELYCIDEKCKAPVIFVGKGTRNAAYFKTVGRSEDTRHNPSCGFYEPLDVAAAIDKVAEYQSKLLLSPNIKENARVVRLNMNVHDPDRVVVQREARELKPKDQEGLGIKNQKDTPEIISSMSSVVKLLTQHEPDVLSTIYFNISGQKLPLSEVVLSPKRAYEKLWSDQAYRFRYFVYGKIEKVVTLEKVTYMDVENDKEQPFTLVVFKDYYKNFPNYGNFEELKGKDVLVYGTLKKNDYENRKKCEIIVSTEKYLAKFKRNSPN